MNAGVLPAVAAKLHFSAVTVPNGYWEVSPGMPAYHWLPPEARFRQIRLLRAALPREVLLLAVAGGIMGIPSSGEYVEFSYLLHDAPEQVEAKAHVVFEWGRREPGVRRVQRRAE